MSEASPKGKSRDGRNTKSPGAILHDGGYPYGGYGGYPYGGNPQYGYTDPSASTDSATAAEPTTKTPAYPAYPAYYGY